MNDGKPWAFPKLGGLARRCSAPVAEVQTVALPCCSLEAAGVCMHRVCAGQDTQTPGSWARPCRHSCAMLLWLTVMLWSHSAPVLLGVCSKVISFLLAVMALAQPLGVTSAFPTAPRSGSCHFASSTERNPLHQGSRTDYKLLLTL